MLDNLYSLAREGFHFFYVTESACSFFTGDFNIVNLTRSLWQLILGLLNFSCKGFFFLREAWSEGKTKNNKQKVFIQQGCNKCSFQAFVQPSLPLMRWIPDLPHRILFLKLRGKLCPKFSWCSILMLSRFIILLTLKIIHCFSQQGNTL